MILTATVRYGNAHDDGMTLTNRVNRLINSKKPRTPALRGAISRMLERHGEMRGTRYSRLFVLDTIVDGRGVLSVRRILNTKRDDLARMSVRDLSHFCARILERMDDCDDLNDYQGLQAVLNAANDEFERKIQR